MTAARMMVGVALCALAAGATGAGKPPVSPEVSRLLACRALPDAGARLSCFDREAATLGGDLDKGQVVVVDKAAVRAAQRSRFGLAAPGLELFAGKDGAALARVNTTVASAGTDAFGKVLVTLADGSRWHQIDDYPLARAPRKGDAVVIARAAVGSFKMAIAGQGAVRVRRDR